MVPKPVWEERPEPEWKGDPTVKTDAPVVPPPPVMSRKVSGKPWKSPKGPTNRTQSGKTDGSSAFAKRQELRKKEDAVKRLEREMKDEKQAEIDRKREIRKERQLKAAEKARLEQMAAKMSAKKLQRMKKRMGRTKKVSA